MTVLAVERVSVGYRGYRVLEDVSLQLADGEFVSLIGPNGAGKTTLLRAISGALPVTSGRMWYRGVDITNWKVERRSQSGIGKSFQTTSMFPGLTVLENVQLAVEARNRIGLRGLLASVNPKTVESAYNCLEQVGLADFSHLPARALSHGDKRKLELAMLLGLEPKVVLLDEPTAGMSLAEVPAILDLIAGLKQTGRYAVILVEHKLDVVMRLSDRVAVLHQGTLLAEGTPGEVMANAEVERAYLGGHHGTTA